MHERRALIRHKTFFKGRICYNNGLSSTDCIVRDATDHGGRLEVSANVAIPDTFELYFPAKNERLLANVKWRRGSSVGVGWGDDQTARSAEHGSRSELTVADRLVKLEHQVAVLQARLDALKP